MNALFLSCRRGAIWQEIVVLVEMDGYEARVCWRKGGGCEIRYWVEQSESRTGSEQSLKRYVGAMAGSVNLD